MNIAISVFYIFPIMLALCLMLSLIHYAQNNAGIIGGSLMAITMKWRLLAFLNTNSSNISCVNCWNSQILLTIYITCAQNEVGFMGIWNNSPCLSRYPFSLPGNNFIISHRLWKCGKHELLHSHLLYVRSVDYAPQQIEK